MEKRPSTLAALSLMLLLLWLILFPAALACSPIGRGGRCNVSPPPPPRRGCNVNPSPNGRECRTCIVNQMKFGCLPCVPVLRCMARCLWGGSSRMNCIKRCDCGGNPKLSDCKKCMSRCKCSCLLSSS